MPIGKPSKPPERAGKLVAGRASAESVVRDDNTGEEKYSYEDQIIGPISFNEPYCTVSVEHGTTMSINYQTVNTKVFVSIPCRANRKSMEMAYDEGWSWVERQLASRAEWARDVLKLLGEYKRQGER